MVKVVYDDHPITGAVYYDSVPDGVDTGTAFTGTDNRAAFQAALDYAGLHKLALYVPPGIYRFADPAVGATPYLRLNYPDVQIIGAGAGATRFLMDDNGIDYLGNINFLETANLDASTNRRLRNRCDITGVSFHGRWSHFNPLAGPPSNWNGNGGRCVLNLECFAEVVLRDIGAYDIRGLFSLSQYCDSVKVNDSTFERICRDTLRFVDSNMLSVVNCSFRWIDDDVISAPTITNTQPLRSQISVTGCQFFQCESLYINGARQVTIENNNFILSKSGAIRIGGETGTNIGHNTSHSIVIADNTIVNTTTRYDTASGGLLVNTPNTTGITIDNPQIHAPAGTALGAVPGFPTTAVPPVVVDPRGKDLHGNWLIENWGDGINAPFPYGFGQSIHDNQIHQTMLPVAHYSDWGYGQCFHSGGWRDPVVLETNMAKNAISLISDCNGVHITDNNCSGFRSGAAIFLYGTFSDNPDAAFDNILISGNIGRDVKRGVDQWASGGATMRTVGVRLRGNIWDCDPYHKQPTRNPAINGTWQSGVAAADLCVGVNALFTKGWTIDGDTFSNCSNPIYSNVPDYFRDQVLAINCVVICDPVFAGFHASNKGVGTIHDSGTTMLYEIRYCDPTDAANFRKIKNVCLNKALAMPTTGTYVRGAMVNAQQQTVAAGKLLIGWIRLTTGSAHVAGTDWSPLYCTVT